MDIKLWVATKAFIVYQGKLLVIRESSKYSDGTQTGKYGEVGGRVTPGENFRDSLIREVKEETGLDIKIGKPFFVNEWRPVVRGEQWQIVGIFFECFADTDEVVLSEDHDDYKWIEPANWQNEGMIENLRPVFEAYLKK